MIGHCSQRNFATSFPTEIVELNVAPRDPQGDVVMVDAPGYW